MDHGLERERQEALVKAVGTLRRRQRTVAEMHGWLSDREYSGELIDETLSELIAVGELDDDRFARVFAEDKRELAGWGPERIEATLIGRGIERSLAESVSGEKREDQLGRAAGLLTGRLLAAEDDAERSRALAYLTRRGFDYELACDAIRMAARIDEAA